MGVWQGPWGLGLAPQRLVTCGVWWPLGFALGWGTHRASLGCGNLPSEEPTGLLKCHHNLGAFCDFLCHITCTDPCCLLTWVTR